MTGDTPLDLAARQDSSLHLMQSDCYYAALLQAIGFYAWLRILYS
jgi:hypothetical protein